MDLSVIIVNYNVKHFLEQCLHSVIKASKTIEAEIIVVDNNSVDGSEQLVTNKFPDVKFIANKNNVGFSRANNQAIKLASGKYILLLNPDTVVEEDTFVKTIGYMDKHPEVGGLGVKMIDGKGNFLPESKRGLPTPWVAFYKMSGLAKLFPKSKKFGKYHLSYLDKNRTHEVDVLAGAFMFLRKTVLEKTGLLDETFFMYGEDIDLSYRITKAGFKNIYFPETTIIHYKGESTKKGSLNYVRVFYNAMIIFARKHFSEGKAGMFAFIIRLAIYFTAVISMVKRIFSRFFLAVFDALLIFIGFLFITPLWENFRFDQGYYPPEFIRIAVPVYTALFLAGVLFSGGYKKPVNLYKVARGIFWGLISILLVYSLVDEKYRFSRALILLGATWSEIILFTYRVVLFKIKFPGIELFSQKIKRIAIVGHASEAKRVQHILENTQIRSELAGFIALDKTDNDPKYIGTLDQLSDIININRISEVIFCAENISSTEIIKAMNQLSQLNIDYKIAPPESVSIIGSNSIHTAGDLYVLNINTISRKENKRKKRLFDVFFSMLFILLCPVLVWFFNNKSRFISNCLKVLVSKNTWISYLRETDTFEKLPEVKKGILTPADLFVQLNLDKEKTAQLNMIYAKDYSLQTDAEILFKGWKNLDRKL